MKVQIKKSVVRRDGSVAMVFLYIGGVFAVVALCIVGFYWKANSGGTRAWEEYAQDAKYPLKWSDLQLPTVAADKNFTNYSLWVKLFSLPQFTRPAKPTGEAISEAELKADQSEMEEGLAEWAPVWNNKTGVGETWKPQMELMKRMNGLKQFESDSADKNSKIPTTDREAAEEILRLLEPGSKIYNQMREALSTYTECLYPIRYQDGFDALLPHLTVIKDIATYTLSRACAHLILGDKESALQEVTFTMDLADTINNDFNLIGALVRARLYRLASSVIWEGIELDVWSESELAQLQTRLAKINFWENMRQSVITDRVWVNEIVSKDIRYSTLSLEDKNLPKEYNKYLKLKPTGWCYRELLLYNEIIDQIMEFLDNEKQEFKRTEFEKALKSLADCRDLNSGMKHIWIAEIFAPSLEKGIRQLAYAQFTVNAAQVACALERYRLKNTKYPRFLNDAEEYLPEDQIPVGWISHRPIWYKVNDKGYTLRNYGWNGVDDAGERGESKSGGLDMSKGDWIWQVER